MNMKEHLLSLGVKETIKLYRDKDFDNFGDYIESLIGERPSGYGIMTGGILLDEDSWRKLEKITVVNKL